MARELPWEGAAHGRTRAMIVPREKEALLERCNREGLAEVLGDNGARAATYPSEAL